MAIVVPEALEARMPDTAAHECQSGAEVEAWHAQAFAEYEAALDAYRADVEDLELKAAYHEARDTLVAGVQYWRQVGEQTGTRRGLGVVTVDDALEEGDE